MTLDTVVELGMSEVVADPETAARKQAAIDEAKSMVPEITALWPQEVRNESADLLELFAQLSESGEIAYPDLGVSQRETELLRQRCSEIFFAGLNELPVQRSAANILWWTQPDTDPYDSLAQQAWRVFSANCKGVSFDGKLVRLAQSKTLVKLKRVIKCQRPDISDAECDIAALELATSLMKADIAKSDQA